MFGNGCGCKGSWPWPVNCCTSGPCSTCPRLGHVCSLPHFGPTPCAPPPRHWKRPAHPSTLRPWIPTSRNCHPPPLCSVALDQPRITKVYEVRYFMPKGCGPMPGGRRTMRPPACAEPLVPSKFMTMV